MLAIILVAALGAIGGCGGSGGGGTTPPLNAGTTKGSYTVTVNGKGNDSAATTATATFALVVN
jgi:hypothetical protein